MPKPAFPAKRRRKGFESVQKGYRSADARLIFFENGLLYCKLTVGCRGWNVWLLVSFGVVHSRFCCALKKAFLYWLALHELKKTPLSRIKINFISRKLDELHSKPFCTHKNFFGTCLSSLSAKNPHFHKTKALLLPKLFLIPTQNNSFLPSTSHSHHP